MPEVEAYAALAGADRRPLLVLRECLVCNGTDDALMNRAEDNERTLLMSRWFHCVKLPPDVIEPEHPYHVLFPGNDSGHLFLARWDGTGRKDLTGEQSRTELWDLMESFLAAEYEGSPQASLKALHKLLDRFDRVDGELETAMRRLDDLIERGQADSGKVRKLRAEIAALEEERAEARAEAVRLSDLALRTRAAEAATEKRTAPR